VRGYDVHTEALGDPGECSQDVKITRPRVETDLPPTINMQQEPFGSPAGCVAPSVNRNCIGTQVAGLTRRLGRKTPPIDRALLSELKSHVRRYCQKHFRPLSTAPDFDVWIRKLQKTYSIARREELIKLWDRQNRVLKNKDLHRICSFIKAECYPEFKHARWINSRSDAFKCFSGPWFHAIEEQVYKLKPFIKHVSVADRPKLIAALKRAGRTYRATDYTSFEAHFVPEVMDAVELVLYDYMLQEFPEIARTLRTALTGKNEARTRRGVKFSCKGRRMSGDMCTSLGNGFTNLMIWDFLYSRRNPGAEWEGYVEGDDGIFAFDGVSPTAEEYASLGFTIKIEDVTDPSLCSFCGVISADGQALRDPRYFLATFGWSASCIGCGYNKKMQLLKAKAMSAIYETPSCPIVNAVARRALALTNKYKARFDEKDWWDVNFVRPWMDKLPACTTTPEMRRVFSELYGVAPEVQIYLEDLILKGEDDQLFHTAQFITMPRAYLATSRYVDRPF